MTRNIAYKRPTRNDLKKISTCVSFSYDQNKSLWDGVEDDSTEIPEKKKEGFGGGGDIRN